VIPRTNVKRRRVRSITSHTCGQIYQNCLCRRRSRRAWTPTTVSQGSKHARADQRQSGWLRDRIGNSDHLLTIKKSYAGIEFRIDRVKKSICDQTLSDRSRVEANCKEQVSRVVARDDSVDFETTNDISVGPDDVGEELMHVDHHDSASMARDEVIQAVVEDLNKPRDEARISTQFLAVARSGA
jgi:hypothetical protein